MRGGDPVDVPNLKSTMQLFPACAGVIPMSSSLFNSMGPFPRMRGGDPEHIRKLKREETFSPHARG